MVNTEGLLKEDVLRVLYNHAKTGGMARLDYIPGDMSPDEAKKLIADGSRQFDYVHGRCMKVDLQDDNAFEEGFYDRVNGSGLAASLIDELRRINR